jgi:23S rRNA (uracil1939-C5)-methyltransferase
MIARHEGMVVLVSGAIPGELVRVEVEKRQRGTVWARTLAVDDASPDRVEAPGDQGCGGNVLAHIAYDRQRTIKQDIVRDAFARIGRLAISDEFAVAPSPVAGYRLRARLHVVDGRIGFFREGTHRLCDAASTQQLRTDTIAVTRALGTALARRPEAGVTEVVISENCEADERALHLVLRPGQSMTALPSLAAIDVRGISFGADATARSQVLTGTPEVTDVIAVPAATGETRITLTRQARSFFQGNRYLLAPLVSAVIGEVANGRVLDLYAGVGLFSVAIAARGQHDLVVAIEGDRAAAEDLRRNAAPFGTSLRARHLPVERYLREERLPEFETVLVDPPRTGLSKEALTGALALAPPRFVYLSCDVATLARDARIIIDAGYELRKAQGFDLFPNTAHVETLTVFVRRARR